MADTILVEIKNMDPINYIADSIKKPNDELLGHLTVGSPNWPKGICQHPTHISSQTPHPVVDSVHGSEAGETELWQMTNKYLQKAGLTCRPGTDHRPKQMEGC